MKTLTLISISFFMLFATTTIAQVDDIKKKSEKYKNNDSYSSDNYGSGGYSSGSIGEELLGVCFEACAVGCFDIGFSIVTELFAEHHSYLMNSRDDDPTALSFDVMMHAALEPNNNIVAVVPRIRGTWGVLSSDFRFNHLIETSNNITTFRTLSWQILALHFCAPDVLSFRIGSGLYYDISDDISFNEHSASLQLKLARQLLLINLEYRNAVDYEHSESVFNDIEANVGFRIMDTEHLLTHLNIGFVNQNYYPHSSEGGKTDFSMIKAGLSFNIH